MHTTLEHLLILLCAAVLAVVVCRSLKLPAMLGYLSVGFLIGPANLGFIPQSKETEHLAEFGIVFLMFSIGLEFSLPKLKAMRHTVFGFGLGQVSFTMILVMIAAMLIGQTWQAGLALGGILAMSSTAIVVKLLAERMETKDPHGMLTIGILLFQDLAVVPLLILIPALGQGDESNLAWTLSIAMLKVAFVMVSLLFFGQKLVRPWFHLVAKGRSSELFVINVLFFTLGVSYLTELAGLSLALGAFLAGMLISETEYRYQVEEDIKPFRDILLGLFFVTIGMRLNFNVVIEQFWWVMLFLFLLIPLKLAIIAGLARLLGHSAGTALRAGLALAQGGEFGFVLVALASQSHIFPPVVEQTVLASILLSMLATPFLIQRSDLFVRRFCGSEWLNQSTHLHQIAVQSMTSHGHVIICGYGRSGQALGRLLEQEKLNFFALDLDPERVKEAAAAGDTVVFGDASKREVLIAAGLMRAQAVVVTYTDTASTLRILSHVQAARPDLTVIVRTQDDKDMEKLKTAGAAEVISEVMEGSLMLASHTLLLLGIPFTRVIRYIRDARETRYSLFRGFFRGLSDGNLEMSEHIQLRLKTVHITPGAYAIGRTLNQLNLSEFDVHIKGLRRRSIRTHAPTAETVLESGDVLILLGISENLAIAEERLLEG